MTLVPYALLVTNVVTKLLPQWLAMALLSPSTPLQEV